MEEFGATNIKDSTALIDDDDLMVFITKDKKGYKIDANKELFSYRYGLKPNLSGHERTPDKGDIDYGKKIRQPLRIPPFIENWNDALKFLNLIFRKHKFGWES